MDHQPACIFQRNEVQCLEGMIWRGVDEQASSEDKIDVEFSDQMRTPFAKAVTQGCTSLTAFPKSGVTYLSFLLFHCLSVDGSNIHDIERKHVIDIHAQPEAVHEAGNASRLIKSHLPHRAGSELIRAFGKVVYLVRDPIDVMMSSWDFGHLVRGTERETVSAAFREFVQTWVETGGTAFPEYGSWVDHVMGWLSQTDVPIHAVRYDDLVDHPDRELRRILDYLDADVSADRLKLAVERSSMRSMSAFEEQEIREKIDGPFYSRTAPVKLDRGYRFINTGHKRSYDTVLNDEQRVIADKVFAPAQQKIATWSSA